LSKPG